MSKSNEEAMKDMDRHNGGDHAAHAGESHNGVHGHEHTKPAGDLRAVVDKEEAGHNQRGDFNRGH